MLKVLKLAAPLLLIATGAFADDVLTGKDAFSDWHADRPGVRRLITPGDLPAASVTSATAAGTTAVIQPMPDGAKPTVPPGFKVDIFARDLKGPRVIRVAPNGDIFVAESGAGRISVFRMDDAGKAVEQSVYFEGLGYPYGIAFYPAGDVPVWLYVRRPTASSVSPTRAAISKHRRARAPCSPAFRRR